MSKAQLKNLQDNYIKSRPKIDDKYTSEMMGNIIRLQSNDELIDSLQRLELKDEFISEYVRAFNPIFAPISIKQVFDFNGIRAKGIAMTMIYVQARNCHAAVQLCTMKKATLRMNDWDPKKFIFDSRGGKHIASLVYDMRIKKGL